MKLHSQIQLLSAYSNIQFVAVGTNSTRNLVHKNLSQPKLVNVLLSTETASSGGTVVKKVSSWVVGLVPASTNLQLVF